jgi:nucleoside-diphosphate-sugar epimerase
MKVLVTGASGAIGRQLVPLLTAAGHDVVGLARSARTGATLAVDVLDRAAVLGAVAQVAPDAIVHMATAIPGRLHPRRMPAEFALTNRLRAEGTRHLLEAARESGVRRVIVQGLAYAYEPADGLADEDAPLWRRPPKPFASSLAALRQLEAMTIGAGGTVLRLGHLYGPGTMFAADGSCVEDIRAGKLPLAGGGRSVFSFIHVADVADAVAAALDRDPPGVLNIVDDDPAAIRDWLPEIADALGAPDRAACRSRSFGSPQAAGVPPISAGCAEPTTPGPAESWAGSPGTARGDRVSSTSLSALAPTGFTRSDADRSARFRGVAVRRRGGPRPDRRLPRHRPAVRLTPSESLR